MVGYVTFGTNDYAGALDFYDRLFASANVSRLWDTGRMAAWGKSRQDVALCVVVPHDGARATPGNGTMVALRMASRAQVDAVHTAAIGAGGTDEGAPGPRGEHGFYGGYFRDLDGNKLNAYVPAPIASLKT